MWSEKDPKALLIIPKRFTLSYSVLYKINCFFLNNSQFHTHIHCPVRTNYARENRNYIARSKKKRRRKINTFFLLAALNPK